MGEETIVKGAPMSKEQLSVCKNFEGRSVIDMFNYFYGTGQSEVQKDAPVLIGTTGAYNPIYGAQLMNQLINEPSCFSAMGMKPYKHSGYRAVSAKSGATVGVAEGAAVPASVKPTLIHVKVVPALHFVNYDMGSLEMALEGKDDVPTFAELSAYMGKEFMGYTDIQVTADVAGIGAYAGTGFDTIQRIISANSYYAAEPVVGAYELNPWGTVLRSGGAGWYDSQMSTGTLSGEAETDLAFTLTRLDTLFAACMPYWEGVSTNNKVIVSGFDTLMRLQALMQAGMIWTGYVGAQMTVDGAKTMPGQQTGFMVAAYNGVPCIPDYNMPKDTLSRLALMDKDHIGIGLITPLMAFDTGPDVLNTALFTGTLTRRGAFMLQGNIWCDKFAGQGMMTGMK